MRPAKPSAAAAVGRVSNLASGPRIYNLFPLLVGTISAWRAELPRIAAMNFDWVYVNPFHETGGSGSCGTTSVVDLATGALVYRSSGCDRTVDPNADPPGLVVREAVYRPGDAHCCPSRVRTTVLVDDGGTWKTSSVQTTTP